MGSGNSFIHDIFDRNISAVMPTLKARFPHIKTAYFAKVKLAPVTQPTSSTYTVKSGNSLSGIASSQGTTSEKIKADNGLTSNTIHPNQILIIKKEEVVGQKIEIAKLKTASIGSKVHIVVETENFQGKTLRVNIKQGAEQVIAPIDSTITVHVGDAFKGTIEIETGKYAAETEAQNKADFADFAIIEVALKPADAASTKTWNSKIKENAEGHAKLCLLVDAHSGNSDIPKTLFSYYGKNVGTESLKNMWLDMDRLWFELTESKVPWIKTLNAEKGVKEKWGSSANPRILEYFEASGYWGTDDSGGDNAWCGSFAAWVMLQHDYQPPSAAYRAKNWVNFGKKIAEPVYGAIGVKSRTGGGHVSFIVGKNAEGTKYYMLGGNQGDEVNVREYPKDVWSDFMIPADYDENAMPEVPIYTGSSESDGSEQ